MSDNPNRYRLPKRVNEQLTFIIFPLTNFMILMFFVGAGIVFGDMDVFLTVGVAAYWFLTHIEKRYPKGYLIHKAWWLGITKLWIKETKTVPDSYKRDLYS